MPVLAPRVDLLHDDGAGDVDGTAEHDGLGAETARRGLAHDDIGGGAEGDLEDALHDNEEGGDGDGAVLPARGEAHDANDEHAGADAAGSEEVEGAAVHLAHEHNGDTGGENVDRLDGHVVVEGHGGAHANGAQHDGGVGGDGLAVEHLDEPGHADDAGATKVGAGETVLVAGLGRLDLLHLVGVLHEGEGLGHRLLRVVTVAGQATQALLGILDAVAADEVPGALGGEEADEQQRGHPDPLEAVGDAPAGVALEVQGAAEDAGGEEAAGTPAHGDPGRQVAAHGGRADLGGVGGGQGLEDAPGDTADDVAGDEHADAVGEEEDEDGGTHGGRGALEGESKTS
ncbi:hypothetical protein VDGD_21579 [Verticillium dahliae]|nr:hypothetical protein VDGD_21579 [Verticillium dahliae]